jgi:hypothetical protein
MALCHRLFASLCLMLLLALLDSLASAGELSPEMPSGNQEAIKTFWIETGHHSGSRLWAKVPTGHCRGCDKK